MAKYADPTKSVTSPREGAPEKKSSMAKKYDTAGAKKGGVVKVPVKQTPVAMKKGGAIKTNVTKNVMLKKSTRGR